MKFKFIIILEYTILFCFVKISGLPTYVINHNFSIIQIKHLKLVQQLEYNLYLTNKYLHILTNVSIIKTQNICYL